MEIVKYDTSAAADLAEIAKKLPGEGAIVRTLSTRVRIQCDDCGEPACYKHTFLLDNARNNPASSAYGKDDCTWCEDGCLFVCEKHKNVRVAPRGQSWCSTFPANEQFAHLFLRWEDGKPELVSG